MKKLAIILGMIALCGISHAQYYGVRYVPEWQGPKRAWFALGAVQNVGVPDFGSVHPDEFNNPMAMQFSLGLDLESGSEGFSTGPYFHLEYAKDSWTADFSSERPSNYSNPVNENFIFRYDMTCAHVGGTFGWGFFYHFGDSFEVGVGAGGFLNGSINTDYKSTIIRKADGAVLDETDERWFVYEKADNPMHIGVEGKFDAIYYFVDNIYVGLQARYDILTYCSLLMDYNYVGYKLTCSENNRPRMVAMLTFGARW